MKHLYMFLLICLGISTSFAKTFRILISDSHDNNVAVIPTSDATYLDSSLKGYIEYAKPPDACSEIAAANFPANFTMKKLVLVNGTNECDFKTKAENAVLAGYDAAVLFNPSTAPFEYDNMTFPIPASEVNITVFLVFYEDGILIRDNYLYNKSKQDNFTLEIYSTFDWMDYLGSLVLQSIFLMLFYIVYRCVLKVIKTCKKRRLARQEVRRAEATRRLRAGLAKIRADHPEDEVVRHLRSLEGKFPSVQYSEELSLEQNSCEICAVDFQAGDMIRILKCPHVYHSLCIDKWVLKYGKGTKQERNAYGRNCPYCTKKVEFHSSNMSINVTLDEKTPLLQTFSSSVPSYSRSDRNLYVSEILAEPQGSVNQEDV